MSISNNEPPNAGPLIVDSSTKVRVTVGEPSDAQSFEAHEYILCANSQYFRKIVTAYPPLRCYNLTQLGDCVKVFDFPKLVSYKPKTFDTWLHYAYTKTIQTTYSREDFWLEVGPVFWFRYQTTIRELCDLYRLAEALSVDDRTKNTIFKTITTTLATTDRWDHVPCDFRNFIDECGDALSLSILQRWSLMQDELASSIERDAQPQQSDAWSGHLKRLLVDLFHSRCQDPSAPLEMESIDCLTVASFDPNWRSQSVTQSQPWQPDISELGLGSGME